MDINNDLQQINTFVKGMNTDVSDALMDSSQYRYAENVRLATNKDENTGELRLIEGTDIYANLSNYGEIIAMTSIRDLLIVITDTSSINYILVKDTSKPETSWRPIFKSKDGDVPFSKHISLVTRWESDNNVKLYIADGKHPLMYINLMAKDGDRYVISEGTDSISGIKNVFLNLPVILSIGNTGHLNSPKVQYGYRLYKIGGATTTMSVLSKLVVLYKSDSQGYPTPAADGSYSINKSVTILIPENTTDCQYLLIFRLSYPTEGLPIVSMIYDDAYIQLYTDTGYDVQSVDYSEFLSYIQFNTVPQIIESKNDYLFSANIKDVLTEMDQSYDVALDNISQYIDLDVTSRNVYIDNRNRRKFYTNGSYEQEQVRSLHPGETYRYGVVLYDSNGNHTSAKYLKDITINDQYNYPITKSNDHYIFLQIGVTPKINWKELLQICPDCVAVEIVRCKRTIDDTRTITQGLAGYPLRIWEDKYDEGTYLEEKNIICSPGIITTNRFAINGHLRPTRTPLESFNVLRTFAVSDNLYLLFASPEYVYQKDDIKDIISSDTIQIRYDGQISTDTTNNGYSEEDTIGYLNCKRVKTRDGSYDYGVPYSVFKAPNEISQLYPWLYEHYIESGQQENEAPDYIDYEDQNGTTTYIHTAWIACHMAIKNRSSHAYINGMDPGKPKVYFSASEYEVTTNSSPVTLIVSDQIGFADVPDHDKLFDNDILVGDTNISIGPGVNYLNWILPIAYNFGKNSTGLKGTDDEGYINLEDISGFLAFLCHTGLFTYPIGSTGECMILKSNVNTNFNDDANTVKAHLVSIIHDVIPYGGLYTRETSTYTSFGNVILSDTNYQGSVKTENPIYDGDCFPGVFIYNASHAFFSPLGGTVAQGNVLMVPLYSSVDLSGTFGDLFPLIQNGNKYWLLDKACSIPDVYTLDKYAYMYNTTYSLDPTSMSYTSIEYTDIDSVLFDTRVYHSNLKTNNEHIDNWLIFQPNNYIDVDSRFGEITNMRLFKDKLLFWQEHAVGILSVNERTVLNDIENNDIVVGTGGTLQRYDYISTVYGMKPHQYEAEVLSNYVQYWWDGYNKEILAYSGGMELIQLAKTKGITNYINEREESTHPMLAYDTKYDEVLAQVVTLNGIGETVVYNEQIQNFSSVYTYMPLYRSDIGNSLYLTDTNNVYILNKQQDLNYSILFGTPAFPKVRIVVNKNNIYTKTFDNLTFGGRMYKGSLLTIVNWPMERVPGEYIKGEHLNSPMHHLKFTFKTPLKQKSSVRGDNAVSITEYDYRLAIPRNRQNVSELILDDGNIYNTVSPFDTKVDYGNRMRGKTMQCEIASDYNSTDFSLQYITTKFRMSWS